MSTGPPDPLIHDPERLRIIATLGRVITRQPGRLR
jgi:hypothetical protein